MKKILVKLPSRERPGPLGDTLANWRGRQTSREVHYLVSLDANDQRLTENLAVVRSRCPKAQVVIGESASKVSAINRDMAACSQPWDILVLVSDDMRTLVHGWDRAVSDAMEKRFPKMDGALHYPDGIRTDLITLSIMGRRLYEAFGYIYHPSYSSLWCDNEFTEAVKAVNRYAYENRRLFSHRHFTARGGIPNDALYVRNESLFEVDRQNFERRKAFGFDTASVTERLASGA